MKRMLLASDGRFAVESMKMLFNDISDIQLAYITTASKGASDIGYLDVRKRDMNALGVD